MKTSKWIRKLENSVVIYKVYTAQDMMMYTIQRPNVYCPLKHLSNCSCLLRNFKNGGESKFCKGYSFLRS